MKNLPLSLICLPVVALGLVSCKQGDDASKPQAVKVEADPTLAELNQHINQAIVGLSTPDISPIVPQGSEPSTEAVESMLEEQGQRLKRVKQHIDQAEQLYSSLSEEKQNPQDRKILDSLHLLLEREDLDPKSDRARAIQEELDELLGEA